MKSRVNAFRISVEVAFWDFDAQLREWSKNGDGKSYATGKLTLRF